MHTSHPGWLPHLFRPTTAKKARRAAPAPNKAGGGGGGRPGSGSQSSAVTVARAVSYEVLGGVEDVLSEIRELIEYPLKHPEVGSLCVCVYVCVCCLRNGIS